MVRKAPGYITKCLDRRYYLRSPPFFKGGWSAAFNHGPTLGGPRE